MTLCKIEKCNINIAQGDRHSKCLLHRKCTSDTPCVFDKNKSQDYWDNIAAKKLQLSTTRRSTRTKPTSTKTMPPLERITTSTREGDGRSGPDTSKVADSVNPSKKAEDRTENYNNESSSTPSKRGAFEKQGSESVGRSNDTDRTPSNFIAEGEPGDPNKLGTTEDIDPVSIEGVSEGSAGDLREDIPERNDPKYTTIRLFSRSYTKIPE